MNPWRGLKNLPHEIWILFAATLVNRAGTMVLPFLVLYITQTLGISPGRAALALTVYGIAALITISAGMGTVNESEESQLLTSLSGNLLRLPPKGRIET